MNFFEDVMECDFVNPTETDVGSILPPTDSHVTYVSLSRVKMMKNLFFHALNYTKEYFVHICMPIFENFDSLDIFSK